MADEGFGVSVAFASGFLAEITAVNGPDEERKPIGTSHSATTGGDMTFQPSDLVDHGTLSVEIAISPDKTPPIKQPAETITITYPIPAGKTTAATAQFSGFMTKFSPKVPFDDKMTGTAEIKISGAITRTASS